MGFEYFLPVNSLPLFEKKKKQFLEKLCSKGEKIAQIPSLFADLKHEEPSWAIEMAQQLIVKSLLPEDQVWFPIPMPDSLQPLVALVAEVPMSLVSMVTHMHVRNTMSIQ